MIRKATPIAFNSAVKTDELDDSIVLFDEPLQIVGTNERQWNGTVYDLNSTDVTQWDGIITQNHDSKLTDVIGKTNSFLEPIAKLGVVVHKYMLTT